MKEILLKISSFTLAFLVLFSTFSFTVEKHFCGDFLIDTSYLGEAQVCNDDIKPDLSIETKKCCKDEVQSFEGQDELQLTDFDKISFENQQFLTAYFTSYKALFSKSQLEKSLLKNVPPPEIFQNYQVTYQSFLI